MSYDHWKTTNPDDEWLDEPDPDEAPELTDEFFERAVWEKDGKTVYDPIVNAYRSWELAMEELHALTVRLLQDDHA